MSMEGFPAEAAAKWIGWLAGETGWSTEIRSAILQVVAHASDHARLPTPYGAERKRGNLANPKPPRSVARTLLEALTGPTPPEEVNWHFLAEHGLETLRQALGRNASAIPPESSPE